MSLPALAQLRVGAAILASGALASIYVRGDAAWLLGFVFLVPWLATLDRSVSLRSTLLRAYGMSLVFTLAAFAWFGAAVGTYTQIGAAWGVVLLLMAAPLFQPQFFAFAVMRHLLRRRHGTLFTAVGASAAWVALEWLMPKLLGDTLGYGLHSARFLRQGAELGGAAVLTLMLLLSNEALAEAWARRAQGPHLVAVALMAACALPLLMAAYGAASLAGEPAPAGKPLRVGLIQANIVAYERQRQEKGAHTVVREILDTHFAMSYDAVERQGADAVMWSETAYPTTFANPKSDAGAEFDQEITSIVNAAGVPFIFGTYDRDGAGEYNAAAFVQPRSGLLGFYRKTNLFPLTEYVPRWMDGPLLRRLLPWVGDWKPGNGARVFPLTLKDGREIPVQPLICYDDVDADLAIGGARLGAQALLTMSNDSWFAADSLGPRMHQAAAAFRSIETRLPQFRVTTNGYSAVIDATGEVLAGARVGEQTLVIGDVPVRSPAPTLMVLWGDWVGRAGAVFLIALAAWSVLRRVHLRLLGAPQGDGAALQQPAHVAVLPPVARAVAATLRALARAGLLYMCVALLMNEALRTNTLGQLRMFALLIAAPAAASWCLLFLYSARAVIVDGRLVLSSGVRGIDIAMSDIVAVNPWRVQLPCPGLSIVLASGERYALALVRPHGLAAVLAHAGRPQVKTPRTLRGRMHAYLHAVLATRGSQLDHPLLKYALLSLVLAIPAFHLQQQIAYGGAFGEYYTYGLNAYLSGFAIWWAAWTIGVVLCDALLRAMVEAGTMLAAMARPRQAVSVRQSLQRAGHAVLFLGMPAWLLVRVLGN